MIAKGILKHTKWDEVTSEQISDSQKMTKASVEFSFSGQLEGKAAVEYLMYYKFFDKKDPHKAKATYVGLFRFEGKLNGKAGTFVMLDRGVFENGEARSELKVLGGSGTGELQSISGLGSYVASKDSASFELHYALLSASNNNQQGKAA